MLFAYQYINVGGQVRQVAAFSIVYDTLPLLNIVLADLHHSAIVTKPIKSSYIPHKHHKHQYYHNMTRANHQ